MSDVGTRWWQCVSRGAMATIPASDSLEAAEAFISRLERPLLTGDYVVAKNKFQQITYCVTAQKIQRLEKVSAKELVGAAEGSWVRSRPLKPGFYFVVSKDRHLKKILDSESFEGSNWDGYWWSEPLEFPPTNSPVKDI